MRKTVSVILAVLFLFAFTSTSHAQFTKNVLRGPVVAVDYAKNQVIVTNDRTGENVVLTASPEILKNIAKGKVYIFRVQAGTNTIKSFKEPVPRKTIRSIR